MKIYNKKGFAWGVFWSVLGVVGLYHDIVRPVDFLPRQIKHVAISVVLLLMGVTFVVRAFSKTATREDRIEAMDERNRLVKLKYKARSGDIMFWITAAVMVLSLLAYLLTENPGWGFIFVTSGVLAGISILVELITAVYYERKE